MVRTLLSIGVCLSMVGRAGAIEPGPDAPMERSGRVPLETLGGLGGAAVGALVGYGVARAFVGDGEFAPLAAAFIGGIPGIAVGLPTGIYLVGEACGGDGSYWATLGGVFVGATVPTIFTLAMAGMDEDALLTALWIVLPTAGGVIGYELSQREPGPREAATRLWVSPLEGGWFAGLSGSFP